MSAPLPLDQVPDPLPGMDHFSVFGLPRAVSIDAAVLEQRLLSMSRRLHPDHRQDAGERARSMLQIAQLNEAYAVLADDWRRAEYLLELLGGPKAHEHKGVPPGFLEAMMELRDELEDALAAETGERRAVLEERLLAQLDEMWKRLEGGAGGGQEATPVAYRETLNQAAYLRSLLRDLRGER